MVIVRVLGPTAATAAGGRELDLGARKQAEVLALLAAHGGRAVRSELLADLLWRGEPPASAATTLQGYVSRLRRLLEPDRASGEPPRSIVTVGDAYRLDLATDAAAFEAEVRQARDLISNHPVEAARVLDAALATWRGPAYADVRDVDAVVPEAQRLDELQVVARELHAQAQLDAGDDAEVVPDLRRLVAEYPLREHGAALLATALYRCGRQADALGTLRLLRERLVDELGVDPGPDIAALEKRLLNQDPGLLARPAAPSRPRGDFAGRRRELAALQRAWETARGGAVVTAVVRGEAGIGKTRLVEELVDRSRTSARWGRCTAAPGAPAFWPWAQVLGGLPSVASGLESGRFAFGLDLGNRLRQIAGSQGAVVVLDDVQWADADSLVVLEIALDLLRDVPLLLIATLRDDPPRAPDELRRALAGLARREGHVDLRLRGLSAHEASTLLAALTDQPWGDGVAEQLAARTGGNPYFLRSLAVLGPDPGLPGDVRDTVRQRVAALPIGGAELMAALALAGRELPLAVAASAAGRSLDEVEQPLAAALRGGLIEESAPGRLRLGHDIIREAVAADVGPAARSALHQRLADAFAANAVGPAAAIAEHRLAAAGEAIDDRAARAALHAAREALAAAALDDATAWAHRGLTVAADDTVRADLHRIAGTAARRAGRLEMSEVELRQEAAIARRSGDWARLAEAALESVPGGVGGYWALGMPLLGGGALLAEALTHVDGVPAPLRARLLAAEATQRVGADRAAATELAERALHEAGPDRDARARALIALVLATWSPETAAARLAQVEEMLPLCGHDSGLEATAFHLHRCVLLELGRMADSARASRRFTELAQRTKDPDLALLDTWWEVGLRLLQGDADRARALAASAAATAALASPAAATLDLISRSTVEGVAAWQEGRLLDVVPDAADLAAGIDPGFLLVVALGHAEAGHRDVALPLIDRLLASPPQGNIRLPWTIMLTAALVALGDAQRLAGLLPALQSYGDRVILLWPGDTSLGPAQLYLGGALAVTGQTDEARRVLTAALQQAQAIDAQPYVSRAQTLLAALQG